MKTLSNTKNEANRSLFSNLNYFQIPAIISIIISIYFGIVSEFDFTILIVLGILVFTFIFIRLFVWIGKFIEYVRDGDLSTLKTKIHHNIDLLLVFISRKIEDRN